MFLGFLAGVGLLKFCICIFMWAGKKGRGTAGGMEEITVVRERGLELATGNSWNI